MFKKIWPVLLALVFLAGSTSASDVEMPKFVGIHQWFNTSRPLTRAELRGDVVLVDFWTYSCVNCLRTLPQLKAWYQRYHSRGLEIVGVHSPEFSFEKDPGNVKRAIKKLGVTYPVAMDNDHRTWNAYYNRYWPAEYLVDRQGHVRHQHFGEGGARETETLIRQLLKEGHPGLVLPPPTELGAARPGLTTPEIYLGTDRLSHLGNGPDVVPGPVLHFQLPSRAASDRFYLGGSWRFSGQYASLVSKTGSILIRFRGHQANMVLDTDHGQELGVRVLIDGHPATATNKGSDVVLDHGRAVCKVRHSRLYTLAQFPPDSGSGEHSLKLEITGPGLRAYTFTFG